MKKAKSSKQEIFIGATVQPLQPSQLLAASKDFLLFINKRSLIVMDLSQQTIKSCSIEDEKILSSVYYENLQVFMISTDKYLLVVNKEAEVIGSRRVTELIQAKSIVILNMQDGYQGIPYQRKDRMLYFTNQYMFEVDILIKYERSLLKSKSLCDISLQFTTKPKIAHFQWSSNFVNLNKINLLICWNQSETYVFETPKKLSESVHQLYVYDKILRKTKLSESDNKINAFEASIKNRLLLAAFQLGSIKGYKLDETKKYVCQLRGHQRQCTGLYISDQSPDLLYSCGLDNCVRIWDLLDFGQVYHVRFDVICSKIQLLNQKLIFAKSVDNRRSYFVKLNIQLLKPILSEPKSGRLVSLNSDGQWGISLYSNNFMQAFLLGNYDNEGRQFTQRLQFPIKYGFLRSSIKLKAQTFAICLQKGFSIIKLNKKESESENFELKRLVYNHSLQQQNQKGKLIEIIHQKLLGTYFFTILSDWKNIPIAIHVTAVSFVLNIVLPKWDIDVMGKSGERAADFVVLGTDRGYIYFVDVKDRNHFYSRVNFHSDEVCSIQQIFLLNSQQLSFISLTLNHQLAIWQLPRSGHPSTLIRINFTRQISVFKSFKSYLAIGSKSGQFNIFQLHYKSPKSPQTQTNQSTPQPKQYDHTNFTDMLQFKECLNNKDEGHLKTIVSIDYIEYKGHVLWLTGGEDYAIKLWKGIRKQLVIQIRIFSMINCVIFAKRDLDVIVSHGENGQISVISDKWIQQLSQCKSQLDKVNEEAENSLELHTIQFRPFMCPQKQPSPTISPKKKQKDLPQTQKKSQEAEQLIKLRSMQKDFQLLTSFPMSQRRSLAKSRQHKNMTPTKELDGNLKNNSVVLPKIGSKKYYVGSESRRYGKHQESQSYFQRLSQSKLKSYSHAGRRNS